MDRPRDALAEGTELAGYVIGRVLGRGGFGITYLAADSLNPELRVAIKEFLPSGLAVREAGDDSVHPSSGEKAADFAKALARFEDEARTLVALRHPNIVEAQRFIKANGTAYVVMKYEEGASLASRIAGGGTLSAAQIARILPPLLDGLEQIHARDFIHRDIKPDNIYLRGADGSPVLLDFGAARQAMAENRKTSLTEIVTPGYAPYEQYDRSSQQGPYTDIYALGATLYRCVTGEKPAEAPARVNAAARRMPDPNPPARAAAKGDFPPALLDAIDKALAIFETDRPQTVDEFRRQLAHGGVPDGAPPASPDTAARILPESTLVAGAPGASGMPASIPSRSDVLSPETADRRRGGRGVLVLALMAVILAGGGYYAWSDYRAAQERDAVAAAAAERAAAEAKRVRIEAERKAKEAAEARRQAEAEAAKRAAEEDARRRVEAEEERRRAGEEERKRAAEEEARRRAEADEARRRADEEERKRAAEEDARRRAEADEARRRADEEERKRAAEEDARRRHQEKAKADWRSCTSDQTPDKDRISTCTSVIASGTRGRIDLSTAYFGRALAYQELKQYRRALADYDRSIELQPNSATSYNNRGFVHVQLKDWHRAVRDFDKAVELEPNNASYHANRGRVNLLLGQRADAIRDFREAHRLGHPTAAARLRQLGVEP